ncbi:unnamed protein product [Rhizophagus irregularis]|nr:unnamed protein product [Rhizophagus irregularis]
MEWWSITLPGEKKGMDEINKYSISSYDSVLQIYGISQNPDTKDYTLVLQDGYCEACDKFMKEIKAYSMDEDSHVLEVYGISQHPDTKDYIMVLACWDPNPENRPKMTEIEETIFSFQESYYKNDHELNEQFREAEKHRKLHLDYFEEDNETISQAIYTSRLLNPYLTDCLDYNPNRDASSNVIIITEEFAKRLGLYRSRSTLCSGDQPLPRVMIFNITSNFCATRELVEVQPTFTQYTLPAKNLGKAVCLPAPITIL